MITTIIFDIGGVVVKSPLLGINKFEKAHNLPPDYLNVAITARGPQGAFQRLEIGELNLHAFYEQFGQQMSDLDFNNAAYSRFCSNSGKPCPRLPSILKVDGKKLWKEMMIQASSYNKPIIKLIEKLRVLGKYRVAALTNNFQLPAGANEEDEEGLGLAPAKVRDLFDDYIESSQVGLRKPDPAFFRYALDRLNVQDPKQVLFLDDLGMNLKAAQKLGIHTISNLATHLLTLKKKKKEKEILVFAGERAHQTDCANTHFPNPNEMGLGVGIDDVLPALKKVKEYVPEVDLSDLGIVGPSKL